MFDNALSGPEKNKVDDGTEKEADDSTEKVEMDNGTDGAFIDVVHLF